jgi:hypothetical protein
MSWVVNANQAQGVFSNGMQGKGLDIRNELVVILRMMNGTLLLPLNFPSICRYI